MFQICGITKATHFMKAMKEIKEVRATKLLLVTWFANLSFYNIAGGHQGRASRGIRGHQRPKTPFWQGISPKACFHKTCISRGISPAELDPFKILKGNTVCPCGTRSNPCSRILQAVCLVVSSILLGATCYSGCEQLDVLLGATFFSPPCHPQA